jgi:hypothetical protein
LFWKPSFPHTIVLFPRPPNSSLIVDVIDGSNHTRNSLSKQGHVIGVNFGTDFAWRLRFTRGNLSQFEFEVFEPAGVPDHYILSTARRENFALASPGLCSRLDFGIAPHVSYGFFYLSKNPTRFTNTVSDIATNDSFRYAIHDRLERPILAKLTQHERSIITTHNFSEWSLKVSRAVANRSLVLLARAVGNGTSPFPGIRAVFTSTSRLTVLHESKMARRGSIPDDPCTKVDSRTGKPRRSWKKWKARPTGTVGEKVVNEGVVDGETDSKPQDGGAVVIGLGILLLFAFVIWRLQNPVRRIADMDGLIDRTRVAVEDDEF